jgi:undecaprenyl-diphosphatase
MIETLEHYDRQLFLFLNSFNNDTFDWIMSSASDKMFWWPVYLFIFILVQRKFGWKGLGWFVLGIALVITFCDQLSSSVLKPWTARYRPCNNLDIMSLVHTVKDRCGGGFSFVSGHATNYFGISIFGAGILGGRRAFWLFMLWAGLIAYSRIYLGVHYPSDVLGGSILGIVIGCFILEFNDYLLRRTSGKVGIPRAGP